MRSRACSFLTFVLLIWAGLFFPRISLRARAENTSASPSYPPACAYHFAGANLCSELGSAFQRALAQGQELCRERYDSPIDGIGSEVNSCSLRQTRTKSHCVPESSSTHTIFSLSADFLQISETSLARKIAQVQRTYAALSYQVQPGSVCSHELKLLDRELEKAAQAPTCPPAAVQLAHETSHSLTSRSIPQPPPPNLPSHPAQQNPSPFFAVAHNPQESAPPSQSVKQDEPAQARPPKTASETIPETTSDSPQSPDMNPTSEPPGLTITTTDTTSPPSPPPDSFAPSENLPNTIFPTFSQWPPQCALQAMVRDLEKQKKADQKKGWIRRTFSHLFGGGPPSHVNDMIDQPSEWFGKLGLADQARYLTSCINPKLIKMLQRELGPAGSPPQCAIDAMVSDAQEQKAKDKKRSWLGKFFSSFSGGAPAVSPDQIIADPQMSFFRIEPETREKYLASCPSHELKHEIDASLAHPLKPPQCALNAMIQEVQDRKDAYAKQGWISRTISGVFGGGPPARADEILKNPEEAFASLTHQDRLRFLSACSPDELNQLQFAANRGIFKSERTPRTDGAEPWLGTAPSEQATPDATSGILGKSSSERNASTWPPKCAVNAMIREVGEKKRSYDSKSFLGRGIAWLFGNTPPDHAKEMLLHPVPAFLALDRPAQEKYLAQCQPSELGRELGPAGRSPDRGISHAAPGCALNALKNETIQLQNKDKERGWFGRFFAHLFGNGPPSNADQIVADPGSAFAKLGKHEKSKYEFECAPSWVKCSAGDEPGFFERIRRAIFGAGPLGKLAVILGSGLLGAIVWRIRGGWLPTGSTMLARLIGTVPMAILGGLLTGPWGMAAGVAMDFTLSLIGWANWMGMTNPKVDLPMMTLRGVWQTFIPGLLAMLGGVSPWFTVAGAVMGPIYYIMNRWGPRVFPNADNKGGHLPYLNGFADKGTSSAEVFTGFALYSLFALAALTGNHHVATALGSACPKSLF